MGGFNCKCKVEEKEIINEPTEIEIKKIDNNSFKGKKI